MIVVRVELHSARNGGVTELARMHICNRGDGTTQIGNYDVRTLRGRSTEQLDKNTVQRAGSVRGYPRLKKHIWVLVLWALLSCQYGEDLKS